MMEVTLGLPTASSLASERTSVQLAMMTAKLEKGDEVDLNDLICQWLSHGPAEEHEAERTRFVTILDAIAENPTVVTGTR